MSMIQLGIVAALLVWGIGFWWYWGWVERKDDAQMELTRQRNTVKRCGAG
jgi:hypothetical protein